MSEWVTTIGRVNWLAGQLAMFPNTEQALGATRLLADHLDRELTRHIDESLAGLAPPAPLPSRRMRPTRRTTAPAPPPDAPRPLPPFGEQPIGAWLFRSPPEDLSTLPEAESE